MNLDVLFEPVLDLPRLSRVLDEMGPLNRVTTIRGWHADQMAALFEAAKGFRAMTTESLVPTSEDLVAVAHAGKNSLPAFSTFEKVFARSEGEIVGYNRGATSGLIGPGYYTATTGPESGEIAVDYRKIPTKKVPAGWPALAPNTGGIPALVFGGMVDILRGVSEHVSIGRAMKKDKYIDAWFVLAREAA